MLGCSVELIDRRTRLLRSLDVEIRSLVQENLHRLGVEITLGEDVDRLMRDSQGAVRLELASGRTGITESVLLLAGETGNSTELDLSALGVAVDPQGHVLIDDRGRSSVPSILAVGSVVDSSGLFSTPLDHILRLARNALGADEALDSIFPWNLHTNPPVAACGLTAESCLRLDLPTVVGRHEAGDSDRLRELLQLVVDPNTSRVLGAQAAGAHAFTAVQSVARTLNREESIDAMIARLGERQNEPAARAIRTACMDAKRKIDAIRTDRAVKPLQNQPGAHRERGN